MNEQDFTLLDEYFNGELSPQESAGVLSRVATDPDFAAAFAFRKDQEEFLQRDARRRSLQESLQTIEADFFKSGGSVPGRTQSPMRARVRLMAMAAAFLLILAAVWFFSRPGLPQYSAYARHEPLALTVRGQNEQAKLAAENAYNAGNYAAALPALQEVLQNEPDNLTVQFSLGVCLLETGRPADARAAWQSLATGNSALKGEAVWNIALSYLYEKNWPELKTALQNIQPGMDHYQEGQKLLKSIPE